MTMSIWPHPPANRSVIRRRHSDRCREPDAPRPHVATTRSRAHHVRGRRIVLLSRLSAKRPPIESNGVTNVAGNVQHRRKAVAHDALRLYQLRNVGKGGHWLTSVPDLVISRCFVAAISFFWTVPVGRRRFPRVASTDRTNIVRR